MKRSIVSYGVNSLPDNPFNIPQKDIVCIIGPVCANCHGGCLSDVIITDALEQRIIGRFRSHEEAQTFGFERLNVLFYVDHHIRHSH